MAPAGPGTLLIKGQACHKVDRIDSPEDKRKTNPEPAGNPAGGGR